MQPPCHRYRFAPAGFAYWNIFRRYIKRSRAEDLYGNGQKVFLVKAFGFIGTLNELPELLCRICHVITEAVIEIESF